MKPLLAALCILAASALHAQDVYPKRPIRLVLPVAAGGGSDITARSIAPKLTEAWGQQVIIDNRPGGGGIMGMEIVSRANPDGYTLIQGSIGPVAIDVSLHEKLPYDPLKDFTPIARGVSALNVLVVHPSLPVSSVKELIAYAKANPTKLNYGSSGVGHADHLAGELFKTMTGVKMEHVAYKGGAPAMTELIGGSIELIFATVSTAVPYMKSGRIRTIAVTSEKRAPTLPDIPTVAESGVPGFSVDNWYSVLGPRGMPKAMANKLHADFSAALRHADVARRLEGFGIFPFLLPTPEAFRDYLQAEIAKYSRIVKAAGIVAHK